MKDEHKNEAIYGKKQQPKKEETNKKNQAFDHRRNLLKNAVIKSLIDVLYWITYLPPLSAMISSMVFTS